MDSQIVYEQLSRRMIHYANKVYADMNIHIGRVLSDSNEYYIRVVRYYGPQKEYELFNYWDDVYGFIYSYMLRHKYRSDNSFIKENMSEEEIDINLSIRGY